jgi:TetR/AcrR family transcriptional repressor of nem operon
MKNDQTNVRRHIIETAQPIILGKGFSAVGLNEILVAADVPKGSFYHYFKSKEAFGEALLECYFADYLERLDGILTYPGRSGADRLMTYWSLWTESQTQPGVEGKCLAVKLGAEVSDLSEPMCAVLEKGTNDIVTRIARCIKEGITDGSLPDNITPISIATALYEMWLGASLLAKVRRDGSAFETAMAVTFKLLNLDAVMGRAPCPSQRR